METASRMVFHLELSPELPASEADGAPPGPGGAKAAAPTNALVPVDSGQTNSGPKDLANAGAIKPDGRPIIEAGERFGLGARLRTLYAASFGARTPEHLLILVSRLEAALSGGGGVGADTFREDLLGLLPDLRRFAQSLAHGADQAEDLVQETLLKAWQNQKRYRPGTNLKAWTFTIMRNQFYTEKRKSRREVADVDGAAAGQLIALADQLHRVALREVWSRIRTLPEAQQEALLLVAAQGMTYEEASAALGCQVGTVKSRVSRARKSFPDALGMP